MKNATKETVHAHLLESIAGRNLYEGAPLKEVSDRIIQKKIKNYQYQDKKASIPVSRLSLETVRTLINKSPYCRKCKRKMTCSNWTLNRIDSEKSHSDNNIEIFCLHCNVSIKESMLDIIVSDFEAFPDGEINKNGHREGDQIPYCVVFSRYKEKDLDDNKEPDTSIYYGLATMKVFEDKLLELSEENKKIVERQTEDYTKWYKNNSAYAKAKENMTIQYQDRVKSFIEKRDRILDKFDDSQDRTA